MTGSGEHVQVILAPLFPVGPIIYQIEEIVIDPDCYFIGLSIIIPKKRCMVYYALTQHLFSFEVNG